jgi:hypothetical protein
MQKLLTEWRKYLNEAATAAEVEKAKKWLTTQLNDIKADKPGHFWGLKRFLDAEGLPDEVALTKIARSIADKWMNPGEDAGKTPQDLARKVAMVDLSKHYRVMAKGGFRRTAAPAAGAAPAVPAAGAATVAKPKTLSGLSAPPASSGAAQPGQAVVADIAKTVDAFSRDFGGPRGKSICAEFDKAGRKCFDDIEELTTFANAKGYNVDASGLKRAGEGESTSPKAPKLPSTSSTAASEPARPPGQIGDPSEPESETGKRPAVATAVGAKRLPPKTPAVPPAAAPAVEEPAKADNAKLSADVTKDNWEATADAFGWETSTFPQRKPIIRASGGNPYARGRKEMRKWNPKIRAGMRRWYKAYMARKRETGRGDLPKKP